MDPFYTKIPMLHGNQSKQREKSLANVLSG